MGQLVNMRRWRLEHNRPPNPVDHPAAERIALRVLVTPEPDPILRRVERLAGHQARALVTHHLDQTLHLMGRTTPVGGAA